MTAVGEPRRVRGGADLSYGQALQRWGEQDIVELTALIGHFACVCWVMNVARTPAQGWQARRS